jgi:hypothetical protein
MFNGKPALLVIRRGGAGLLGRGAGLLAWQGCGFFEKGSGISRMKEM